MKRTYVDIIGEYYDNQNDVYNETSLLGIRASDLNKISRKKTAAKKFKLLQE